MGTDDVTPQQLEELRALYDETYGAPAETAPTSPVQEKRAQPLTPLELMVSPIALGWLCLVLVTAPLVLCWEWAEKDAPTWVSHALDAIIFVLSLAGLAMFGYALLVWYAGLRGLFGPVY